MSSVDAASPIKLVSAQVVTPAGTPLVTNYGASIRTGVTFVNGLPGTFTPGTYRLTLTASLPNTNGPTFTYTGSIAM